MRLKVRVTGAVQGVGFRPFVYRLATELGLKGFILNNEVGVEIEVEGKKEKLIEFLRRLNEDKPPAARIYSISSRFEDEVGYREFEIKKSKKAGEAQVAVLPDLATCEECLRELFNPSDRRYLYPFINCTNCGPRFTIILSLPYDRKNTTMRKFKMCDECRKEYEEPKNRRFHAQPNACPKCGPWVWLVDREGREVAKGEEALERLAQWIEEGKIVAVKGLGGFHLICDATNEEAVKELRRRKRREEKPFAVMFKNLEQVKEFAHVSPLEEVALKSVEAPIVILKSKGKLAEGVSPDTETVGAFLPYTPLHHILIKKVNRPIVATSCNVTDEPIMKDNSEVVEEVGRLVDGALLHNRDIARRCDDSVVRVIGEKVVPIRRSRGFAPLPILLPFNLKRRVLALGAHMKNTVALGRGRMVFLSQHIGDIDNFKAEEFLKETVADLTRLLEVEPDVVVTDRHPGYFTTKWGKEAFGEKLIQVYHHHAHAVALMAESGLEPEAEILALTFDGTGYGEDGTIWGGELLLAKYTEFKRLGTLLQFNLPGGERAVKEPYRVAVSLLKGAELEPQEVLKVEPKKVKIVEGALSRGINSPKTSSMGRLFDGICAILGIREVVSYQAQGAILLEEEASKWKGRVEPLPVVVEGGVIDWREMVREVVRRVKSNEPIQKIAAAFHRWVAESSVKLVEEAAERTGITTVGLTGGVFQNRVLTQQLEGELQKRGFKVLTHQVVPPNDGALSLGQAVYGGLIEKGS